MVEVMTSVVKPGPPRVIVQIRSNVRSPPMNDSRITVKVALRLSGTMTCRNLAHAPPSSSTASMYSSGMDRMPAMKMTSAMPTPFQTSTNATESSAKLGSVSHDGPSIPTTSSDVVDQALGGVHQDRERDARRRPCSPGPGRR